MSQLWLFSCSEIEMNLMSWHNYDIKFSHISWQPYSGPIPGSIWSLSLWSIHYGCMSVRHVLVAALPIPNSSFDCLQYAKRRRIFDNQFPLHSCIYTESDKKLNSCKRLHNWATLVSHETQELALNHHVQNQGWYRLESEPECTCSLIPRLHCGSETSEWKYIHTCKKNSTHSMVLTNGDTIHWCENDLTKAYKINKLIFLWNAHSKKKLYNFFQS